MIKAKKINNPYDESSYLYFKEWEKGNKKRTYINDYKRRTIGYIENDEIVITDRQGNHQEEIDMAISEYKRIKEEEEK